jgi:hypothetical protein
MHGGAEMTFGKSLALAMGFVVAMAVGVWIGPYLTDRAGIGSDRHDAAQQAAPAQAGKPQAMARAPEAGASRHTASRESVSAIPASTPALHERLKPVMNKGTNMNIAAEGFSNAEQFATLAHAARNAEVPFMVLKHRVLTEGKSLAAAIRESNPGVNAAREVKRARDEARMDLEALQS